MHLVNRFFSRVRFEENGCVVWIGARNRYGRIQHGGRGSKLLQVHRLSYDLFNGPVPDDMLVLHKCDNPPCVNPSHLFLGSHQDNADDRERKGRGSKLGRPKTTSEEVL